MNRREARAAAKEVRERTRKFPCELIPAPDAWASVMPRAKTLLEVWVSRFYLVQVHSVPEMPGYERLSIGRCELDEDLSIARNAPHWRDGISWDELQQIKAQCGRGDRCAVELYPPDEMVVNVANLRHLFVYPPCERPAFVWHAGMPLE